MRWVTTKNLKDWAEEMDCKSSMPELIRRLIRATAGSITNIKFPSGENIFNQGWDGILEVKAGNEFFPMGKSVWEVGTEKNIKDKAEDDYTKRSNDPKGINTLEYTFVFVTPRLWSKSEEWVNEKKKQGIWKDVKVINAEKLEEWLEVAPTVGAWLSVTKLGKYPESGIQLPEDFWREWSTGRAYNLNHEILLGGRKREADQVASWINAVDVAAIKATTREESIAFIISTAKENPNITEDFFSRSLIVDEPEVFRRLSAIKSPLILIPRFVDNGIMNKAMRDGHTILAPLGNDSSYNWPNSIKLPPIERQQFINSLQQSGISEELAIKYSKESARNTSILKRQLQFDNSLPVWSKPENVRDIIPALLVGRWDGNNENDQAMLAKVADEPYESYLRKLNKWLHSPDSPIMKIGNIWRLSSPLDAWINSSKFLIRHDFNLLSQAIHSIMNEIDPSFDLPNDKRYMAAIYGKKWKYSRVIREGVIQSSILTSVYGNQLNMDLPTTVEAFIDNLIAELLNNDDPLFWKSINNELPLIAEASPISFLDAIEKHLAAPNTPIMQMFEEEPGMITPHSHHTGLLWALEALAWMPEHLLRASLILAQLDQLDPGGSLGNRPKLSLHQIFVSWRPQTFATIEERFSVLNVIVEKFPQIGWNLLERMLPTPHQIVHPTYQMRWRTFNEIFNRPSGEEIRDTCQKAIDLLIKFPKTEDHLAELIIKSVDLEVQERKKIIQFIDSSLHLTPHSNNIIWHTLRDILSRHRTYPTAEWALSESELEEYQVIFDKTFPANEIDQVKWLFDENWPRFPEGNVKEDKSYEKQEEIISERRLNALAFIYQKHGIKEIKRLASSVKEPRIFGFTLASVDCDEKDELKLLELLQDERNYNFINGYAFKKVYEVGIEWIVNIYEKIKTKYSKKSLTQLFVELPQSIKLWEYIDSVDEEIRNEYWRTMYPRFGRIDEEERKIGLNYLLKSNRFFSAVDVCYRYADEIPSEVIKDTLFKAATIETDEKVNYLGHEIKNLIFKLGNRTDVSNEDKIRLEWIYFPALSRYGNGRNVKHLYNELCSNPEFFVDLIKCWYVPQSAHLIEKERYGLNDEQLKERAKKAFDVLKNWKQLPGLTDGELDNGYLFGWISKARELGKSNERLEGIDLHIGEILAHYPTGSNIWPPEEICRILEEINSDTMLKGFSTEIFNKRGTYSKTPYEGGNQERELSNFFRNAANSHQYKFPKVSRILMNLANNYESDAKREDEKALRDYLEY